MRCACSSRWRGDCEGCGASVHGPGPAWPGLSPPDPLPAGLLNCLSSSAWNQETCPSEPACPRRGAPANPVGACLSLQRPPPGAEAPWSRAKNRGQQPAPAVEEGASCQSTRPAPRRFASTKGPACGHGLQTPAKATPQPTCARSQASGIPNAYTCTHVCAHAHTCTHKLKGAPPTHGALCGR